MSKQFQRAVHCRLAPAILALTCASVGLRAQGNDAESRAESIDLPGRDAGRYFLIAPQSARPASEHGHGLLLVLPGDDGSAKFLPFVENGVLPAAGPDFVLAMLTAPEGGADRPVVWPSQRSRVAGLPLTEDRIAATLRDVASRYTIDPKRTVLLAWSSSGPVAYDVALAREVGFAGFYVAMSVFKSDRSLLRNAKGRRFVLDQSPEDTVTRFQFATDAATALTSRGAAVWLRPYVGGHGWHDAPIPRLRSGLAWLLSDAAPPENTGEVPLVEGENLVRNGDFEREFSAWDTIHNSNTLKVATIAEGAAEGRWCLHLAKSGGAPMDVVHQDVPLAGRTRVQVSALVKSKAAGNAFLKFFAYGPDGSVLDENVDIVNLRGDRDWSRVVRDYTLPAGAKTGAVMLVMVLGGEVWVDDVRVVAPKH